MIPLNRLISGRLTLPPYQNYAQAVSKAGVPELAMTPPEDNPWKNSVVNIEFKDMSNRLFNFGPVPWPGSKENVAQGQSSWGSAGTSISTGVQGLNKNFGPVPNSVPPLGQRVSLGYKPPPPIIQQQKKPLEIVYRRGGTPRVNLASEYAPFSMLNILSSHSTIVLMLPPTKLLHT